MDKWENARQLYLSGKKAKDVAAELGVSYNYLLKKIKKEGWKDDIKKRTAKVKKNIEEKIVAKETDLFSSYMDNIKGINELLGIAINYAKETGEVKAYELKAWADTIRICSDVVHSITHKPTVTEQIALDRLKLEVEKYNSEKDKADKPQEIVIKTDRPEWWK